MISRLSLTNYKGFERYSLKFNKESSVLVGPNNAGKSTIIGALRLCAQLLSYSKRKPPRDAALDVSRGRSVKVHRLAAASTGFIDENVTHEFRQVEARIELHFQNKSALFVVWPVDSEPYFYLENVPGMQPSSTAKVKEIYPDIGVVQTLTPVEHREVVLTEKYVREHLGSRLASKHFRNQLYLMKLNDYDKYVEFCDYFIDNTPEVVDVELSVSYTGTPELDLFFDEVKSKISKEIYWAGDGLQIWFQVVFHVWRHGDVDTLILDEPDVYLHPDLQRRLVSLVENLSPQSIIATHAPEILAEANRDSIIYIDRTKRSSRRVSNDKAMAELHDSLGSGFNLRLAKALRSRVALFVEGNDMKILSNLARQLGAKKFAGERGLTVVPMGGSSNRSLASSFGLLNSTILDSSVEIAVFLDRDYLDSEDVAEILDEFSKQKVHAHVWERNEIESYLVESTVISRLSGMDKSRIDQFLLDSAESLKEGVFSHVLVHALHKSKKTGEHETTTYKRVRREFDRRWLADTKWRMHVCQGKELLSLTNQHIDAEGGRVVSARKLSASIRGDELASELASEILAIEEKLR
ncbi:ATP-dependent endonuclease [Rhodococcus sp. NPDC057014]|uniref:ATP-dependent nuclease n=1 Tax=Rhodococcus sp. NPDC057014 TaxID=3346000 RepID=UPI0036259C0D